MARSLNSSKQQRQLEAPAPEDRKPADPFLIISCDLDQRNELYVVGVLNTKNRLKRRGFQDHQRVNPQLLHRAMGFGCDASEYALGDNARPIKM